MKSKTKEQYKKRLKEVKNTNIILLITVFSLILVFSSLAIESGYFKEDKDSLNQFYEDLETIFKNCNSVMIVKCMSERGWCVFSPDYDNESSYDFVYKPVEDCLGVSKTPIQYEETTGVF